jgi:uncharacterized protein (TIGR02145 family)
MKKLIHSTYIYFILFISAVMLSWVSMNNPKKINHTINEIKIGNQIWMTKNLDVAVFRNGDSIPQAKTKEEWRKAGRNRQAAWCYYENDSLNGKQYGRLYNWYAVSDPRGLAPEGWHIPTAEEWLTLLNTLGGKKANTGEKMKSTEGWNENGNGNNASGFNALPGGSRMTSHIFVKNKGFGGKGEMTMWWSSKRYRKGDDVFCLVIYGSKKKATYWWDHEMEGMSVRCVKN